MSIKIKPPVVIDAEFTVLETTQVPFQSSQEQAKPPIEITFVPSDGSPEPRSDPATALPACLVCGGNKKLKKMQVVLWEVDVCSRCIKMGTNAATLLELILG